MMRPLPVDHSLWLAIGHAAQMSSAMSFSSFNDPKAHQACLDMVRRALDAGANPDAEFTLPGKRHGYLTLTCMERAFGQLHGSFLVPLLDHAVKRGWRPTALPSGLWAAGQVAPESQAKLVDPSPWRLEARLVENEPGWLQLVAQGNPWGPPEYSEQLCRRLFDAGAPMLRPAQAMRTGSEEEAGLAYRELDDPMRLAAGRGGNLNVARALVELGALEDWTSSDSLRHLVFEIEGSWRNRPEEADALIGLVKSRMEALVLEQATPEASTRLGGSSRRSL